MKCAFKYPILNTSGDAIIKIGKLVFSVGSANNNGKTSLWNYAAN